MRKFKATFIGMVLCVCVLAGCSSSSSMSITFSVATGDNIKVTLDTSDGLELSQADGGYTVTENGNDILQAVFVEQAFYQEYIEAVKTQEGVTINQEKSENGITYLSYSYNSQAGTENDFLIWIEGSNTGIVAGSLADLQTATRAFESISFSKE